MEANNDTLMGILSYLGILVIIPFIINPKSDFVRFHAKQGLVLFIIEVVVSVVGYGIFWPLAWIAGIINLLILILVIVGIVNVVQHKESPLPVVGQLASMFKF